MKLSQLKIEPQLTGAFLQHLEGKGYSVTPSHNPQQPYWLAHKKTPDISHIIEIDKYGNWLVPEKLYQTALTFLCQK
ncbi:hypothetical protein [Vibrio algivorus]|uniref:Uncharacterized protein n=1 Tax=Vibrio algivorus TaxID=1667024 RepID=A0A557P9Q6_9VIBR|nr:hypothetical protein [Vibrio algivorus]TVO37382.1 hypothetical protein FOF44_07175 [Vibrio algivorus]